MRASAKDRATYKAPEAAQVAGVGTLAIYKGIAAGAIPHIRFGRHIVIPKHAFHKWLDACGTQKMGQEADGDSSGEPSLKPNKRR